MNARRSFVLLLLRACGVLALWLPMVLAPLALVCWTQLVLRVEVPETIALAADNVPSQVVTAHGFVAGGPVRGGSEWTPFQRIAPAFVLAAVASEDSRFFEHDGFDVRGLLRALRQNLEAGAGVQGGSGITQQLAKSFVGTERTLERKVIELVVARRLEATFSKAQIFEAWANRAYFGAGATGVQAAAQRYFGVDADELDLAQAATLVALIPAPSRFDPRHRPEQSRARRDRVLDRVQTLGLAPRAECDAARAADVTLVQAAAVRVAAPELERAAFREAAAIVGRDDLRHAGLRIVLAADLVRQRHAQAALRDGLWALDARQGLRAHFATLVDTPGAIAQAAAAWAELSEGVPTLAPVLLTGATSAGPQVAQLDGARVSVGDSAWRWMVPFTTSATNHGEQQRDATEVLRAGDVVLLHDGALVQLPRVEGAIGTSDLASGALEVIAGAFDPARSEFDRFLQACRQPGSTFKPIVYSVAIDRGRSVADVLRDAPVRFVLGPFDEWRPRNADGRFGGHMTLWEAFVWSRNLPVLGLLGEVGAERVIERARRLGVLSPLAAVESLALGASCVTPRELAQVYATIGRGGESVAPWAVERIERGGEVVFRRSAASRVLAPARDRGVALWEERAELPRPALSPSTSWIVRWLLREAVLHGTAMELRALPFAVAGKTGTTNAYDAWFAGFSARDAGVVWMGADRDARPLGEGESGGETALPVWAAATLAPGDDAPLLPRAPADLVFAAVDPATGLLASTDGWSRPMPFVLGTQPRRQAPTQSTQDARRIEALQREF